MKGFKKLALASAIAAVPAASFAMQPMEDAALAKVTGQDGVTISIASTSITGVRIDDSNAFTGSSAGNGAIFISGISLGTGATTVVIDADSDTIQAAITLGAGTLDMGVVSATAYQSTAGGATLIDLGTMDHGDITVNVQLGAEDQGHMAVLSGVVNSGITLTGFSISDTSGAVSGGSITTDLAITDASDSSKLTLAGDIDVATGGLQIANLSTMDVTLGALTLGDGTASAIGDVSILGLSVGTVTISGHN